MDATSLAAELAERLRAGAPLRTAWHKTARAHNLDAGIASRHGVEVPSVLEDLGPAGRSVAAAWELAELTGAPLADVLSVCADAAGAEQDAAAARDIALAGPRTSARILSGLPPLGLLGASALGVDVLGQVTGGGIGTASALVGVLLWVAGWGWSARLVRAASEQLRGEDPVVLDLAAAALAAGASVPTVLTTLGRVSEDPDLCDVARFLVLGLAWERAWGARHSSALAQCLRPAWTSGAGAVALLRRRSERLRAGASRVALQAAGRLGARLVVPLGLCYLPSFVLLALVPTILAMSATWWG